jgi:NAD(P)-dependent dehydrogenase (short-subunit alcohol dehydrogenase family)
MGLNRLGGKVAVVTGSTRGIGRAIALKYGEEGAKVVVSGTKADLCDEVSELIRAAGGIAVGVPSDITKIEDIDNLYDKALEHYGRVDVAVNNAGIVVFRDFLDMDYETLSRICGTNIYGTYFCAQRAAREMVKQGNGGKIINMSSITSETGQLGLSAYAPSKAAISLMTKCMALEMAPYRINVNAVGPGTILTDFNRHELDFERDEREIPLGIGEPKDIAGLAVFLATDEASYITGHTIFVDGGYNLK